MSTNLRPLLANPGQLVSEGRFNFGTYKEPFKNVNPLDAEIGRLIRYPRVLKNLRLKEWQHFALVNRDYYISLALFDAKTLALVQVCLYDRQSGSIKFYEKKVFSRQVVLPQTLWDDHATCDVKGFKLKIHNNLKAGVHKISFDIEATKDLPALKGSFTCLEDMAVSEPIVVCLPLKEQRAMYSHKYVCPIEGSLLISDDRIMFDSEGSYGLIDIHKGYYPYVMKWHWATAGGFDSDRGIVGLNLTDNQVKNQDAYNENCLWIEGRIHLLPPVRFHFNRENLYEPWNIHDQQGMVALTFTPEVIRTVDINALIVKTKYRGPFGSFSGTLQTSGGDLLEVKEFFGMCEDFYLRT